PGDQGDAADERDAQVLGRPAVDDRRTGRVLHRVLALRRAARAPGRQGHRRSQGGARRRGLVWLEHTPLDNLSEAARKATSGPAAMKMMAARGLAPLKPFDLACALYTLSLDPDEAIRQAADKSAREAPEKPVLGGLADAALDARIIDYSAPRVATKAPLVEAILLNRTTADDTVVALVPRLVERDLELVAVNEQRLLRCPAIIGALYMN